MIKSYGEMNPEQRLAFHMGEVHMKDKLRDLVIEGLYTDGGHHKQWYLQEIAKVLGGEGLISDVELVEYGEPEEGIAP
jgi:hypothetical protein